MKEQPSFMCSSIRQSGANLFIGIWYDLISCIRMISFLDILQKQDATQASPPDWWYMCLHTRVTAEPPASISKQQMGHCASAGS